MLIERSYQRYVPRIGVRQWHRMNFEQWAEIKRDTSSRANFLAKLVKKVGESDMKLVWLTPRFIRDNDGNRWAYWKAVKR